MLNLFKEKTVYVSGELYMRNPGFGYWVNIENLLVSAESLEASYKRLNNSLVKVRYSKFTKAKKELKTANETILIQSDTIALLHRRIANLLTECSALNKEK